MAFDLKIKKVFRFKDIKEISDALNIRKKVFCDEQKVPKDNEFDGLDNICTHFIAYKNKAALGTARLREKSKGIYKIERVAVLRNYRYNGIGRFITLEVIREAKKISNLSELILHSQIQVNDFYIKLGFFKIGKIFFEENIAHIKMIYKFNDRY